MAAESTMARLFFYRSLGCLVLLILMIEPVLAGPGGRIAKAAYETFWGRIIISILIIFFLPLIAYTIILENLATRRAMKDLTFVAKYDKRFDWLTLKSRVKECFQRVHKGWQDGDLSDVNQWMTSWYWQNQQIVFLDQWKSEGLENVCRVKKIKSVQPLLFAHHNSGNSDHEDSYVVVSITAKMQDYLKKIETGKVVEGSKKWKDVETLWTFTFDDGQWLVSDIEDGDSSLAYAKMRNHLPQIETTMKTDFNA